MKKEMVKISFKYQRNKDQRIKNLRKYEMTDEGDSIVNEEEDQFIIG